MGKTSASPTWKTPTAFPTLPQLRRRVIFRRLVCAKTGGRSPALSAEQKQQYIQLLVQGYETLLELRVDDRKMLGALESVDAGERNLDQIKKTENPVQRETVTFNQPTVPMAISLLGPHGLSAWKLRSFAMQSA